MPTQNVQMTVPASDLNADEMSLQRNYALAQALQQNALQSPANETVSGLVVKQSPLQGLARMLQLYAGQKMQDRADEQQRNLVSAQQQKLAATLQAFGQETDPQKRAMILATSGHPELMKSGITMMDQANKPMVVGRTLMNSRGDTLGVDTTWQGEQEAARKQREAEATAKRDDARQMQADRLAMQKQIADQNLQGRMDLARLTASLKPEKTDPKQTAAYNAGLKELGKDDTQVAQAQALEQAYTRWLELQQKVETGPIAGRRVVSFNPDFQEMKQLENYLAMNNFKPGQGQISNFERQLVKGAGPNTTNSKEANEDIVKVGLGGAQNMKDRANFREQWLQQKGDLLGSDRAWQEYIEKNPRYIRDKAGRIVDNPNRTGWVDYFGGKPAAQPSNPAAPAGKTVTRTGTSNGRKVVQYSDGSIEYAD